MTEFMQRWEYGSSEFGWRAVGDADFIADLHSQTVQRTITPQEQTAILAFMRGGERKHGFANREQPPIGALHFAEEVFFFLKKWDYKTSEFGRRVLGDPSFITELKKAGDEGRSPTLRTVQRVREFMKGGAAKHRASARQPMPEAKPKRRPKADAKPDPGAKPKRARTRQREASPA